MFRAYYVNIMSREKLSSIQLANIELVYWSIRSSSSRGEDGEKGLELGVRYFSITLLENMKIWAKIQVIIHQLQAI